MSHKFQVHLQGLIDLLGQHLYSGPQVFVRELLQNGADAVTARAATPSAPPGQITIEVSPGRSGSPSSGSRPTAVFADNGIGLTEEQVHRFLATIGESSKRAAEEGRPTDYIGQFGIGLLSCFMVSDEIAVVTQSAEGGPALEFRGKPDGTYSLRTLSSSLSPGTQVYLTCKPGHEELFTFDAIVRLARRYGALLPTPIRVSQGERHELANAEGAPWRSGKGPRERDEALRRYCERELKLPFLHAIPLRSVAGDVEGVAFILPFSPGPAAKRADRVYLKHMLMTEKADNLLPDWAFFTRAVFNANSLRPSAARESFYEDATLDAARQELGDCLRRSLIDLARSRPELFERIVELHATALQALSLEDDECFRLFVPRLPVETSQGRMKLGDYIARHDVIRYVPDIDQFRQVAQVASAQGLALINAGYIYLADLLDKHATIFPDTPVEAFDATSLVQRLDDPDPAQHEAAQAMLAAADRGLRPYRCVAELRSFLPETIPAMFVTDAEGRMLRSLDQAKEKADPLWSGILGNVAKRDQAAVPPARLCLNGRNVLVQRMIEAGDSPVSRRAAQMLYVQSLLLGHHPLSGAELTLLNEGLLDMIGWGLRSSPETP